MGVKDFGAALKVYAKMFAVTSIGFFALGVIWLVLTPLQYVSTTQLLVSINGSSTATAYQNDSVVTGRVNSYIVLLTSDAVSRQVVDELGLSMSPGEFAAKVSATNVPPKTSIIDVAVVDDSPDRARQLAETLAEQFIGYADALETPTGDDGQKVKTTVVSAASEPRSRIAERVALGGLAAAAALLAGCVAVWVRSIVDPVLRTGERAAAVAGIPVVGSVTSGSPSRPESSEDYLNARWSTGSEPDEVIVLVSAAGEVDAGDIAVMLADVIAADQRRLEATMSPPGDSAARVAQRTRGPEDTIVSAPPVLSTFTAWPFGGSAHTVLLLVSLGISRRRDVERAAARLTTAGVPLTGVVLVRGAAGREPPAGGRHSHDDQRTAETSEST